MRSFSPQWPLSLQALAQAPEFSQPASLGSLSYSLYPPGLPLGALTLLDGQGNIEAALCLLKEHPELKAAWVEERLSAYPPAFVQQGVNLNCLLFVEGGPRFAWAVVELARSQAFKVIVVASPLSVGEKGLELRRLQLAARQSEVVLLLTAPLEGPAWPLRLRLDCSRTQGGLSLRQAGKKAALG